MKIPHPRLQPFAIILFLAFSLYTLAFLVGRAAQQTINVGTSANDSTGDTLRVAFQKVNSNFTDLYTSAITNGAFGAGNGMVKSGTNLHFATNAAYTDGRIPFAVGTNGIGFSSNLSWNNDIQRLSVGTGSGATIVLTGIELDASDSSVDVTGRGTFGSFTLTGATASTLPIFNASKGLISLANGTGFLQNNGSGSFSWATAVTSVGLSVPSWLSVSGSPVTGSGTLAVTAAGGQTANFVLATPDGSSGAASLRALVAADIPSLDAAKIGSGTLDTNRFPALIKDLGNITPTTGDLFLYDGAHLNRLAAGTAGYVLTANGAGVAPSYAAVAGVAGTTNVFVTVQIETNNFTIGKGGHLTITNSITIVTNGVLTFQNLPWPSVLLIGADGNATNATLSGLSLSGSTLSVTGAASTWVPVRTLAFSTTNVTIPLNGGTNFVVTLTNGAAGYFTSSGAPAAATTNTTFTLTVIQDATGTRVMNWNTNTFQFMSGFVPACTTNANAEDVFTISASAKTAGKFNVTWNPHFY